MKYQAEATGARSTPSVRMLITLLAALIVLSLPGWSGAQDAPVRFDIPSQDLGSALREFGRASKQQIIFDELAVRGKTSPAIGGMLSIDAVLAKLLQDTGLHAVRKDSGVIVIEADSPASVPAGAKPPSTAVLIDEVIVTGSHLAQAGGDTPQNVKIYSRDRIEQSGQTTVANFLSTLPDVSVAAVDNSFQTANGASTVQIHGLPMGTTLVLINGRRIEVNGAEAANTFNIFDLNDIPLAAIERIEVLSEGSSAIYGSDAIAGVINIILKKDFNGLEASAKYGFASGTHEWDGSLAWGQRFSAGSFSIVGSFQARSELPGSERPITADNDYRSFGGIDARYNSCNPGNVFSLDGSALPGVGASFAAVPAGFHGKPSQQEFAQTAGTLNACSLNALASQIPQSRRAGLFAQGNYDLLPGIQLFGEMIFSHIQQDIGIFPPLLFGQPGFQSFTVGATNPFNPFGEPVGVGYLLSDLGRETSLFDTTFLRPLVGLRGAFARDWEWEFAGWDSQDTSNLRIINSLDADATQAALDSSDPAQALDPFTAGPPGSSALLRSLVGSQISRFFSQTLVLSGFTRGPLWHLPAGALQLVLGAEYMHDKLDVDEIRTNLFPPDSRTTFSRHNYALYAESRVPLVAGATGAPAAELLAVTVAARRDSYSDFGAKTTPQLGAEWRPLGGVLVRGTYGKAFKAPSLSDLNNAQQSFVDGVIDPVTGQPAVTNVQSGGNLHLRPETGQSKTLGVLYSGDRVPGLRVGATYWDIQETNSIQELPVQTIVDNAGLFPGAVVRAPGLNGAPGTIVSVNDSPVNFGSIDVAGFDYEAAYSYRSSVGLWTPSLSATQTTRYRAALIPGAAATDRAGKADDDGNFAPRWKGTAALGWSLAAFTANVSMRYIGQYQDYDSTQLIGNRWFTDVQLRYVLKGDRLKRLTGGEETALSLGAVNFFNSPPQYSNFSFGSVGYDPAEADIRGRFLYVNLSMRW